MKPKKTDTARVIPVHVGDAFNPYNPFVVVGLLVALDKADVVRVATGRRSTILIRRIQIEESRLGEAGTLAARKKLARTLDRIWAAKRRNGKARK